MVMRVYLFLLLAMAGTLVGCQTVQGIYTLSPTDTSYQAIRINSRSHAPYLVSARPDSAVAVQISSEKSWHDYGTALGIEVKNTGRKPVAFGAYDIQVSSDGQNSQVLDYAGIQRAIAQRQNNKQAAATFSAIASAFGAGMYAGSPQANPALASAISQEVAASVQASSVSLANSKVEAGALSQEDPKAFLTNVIIPPHGTVSGIVVVTPIAGSTAKVTVTVGNDQHMFTIARQ
jgi:hypothetical protein